MKKDKNPSYIKIGIFTVITTLCWIFFSAYRTLTSKPAPALSNQVLATFSPDLNTVKIEEMQGRIFFAEGETEPVIGQIPTPTPEPTPIPTTEPVPTEEPEATATPTEEVE